MNSFTNAILSLLLGWLRTLLNAAREFVSSDSSTALFDFFSHNWKILFLILCVGGFAMDKIVYLIRWRPSPIWIRLRSQRRERATDTKYEAQDACADTTTQAYIPPQAYAPPQPYDDSPAMPTEVYRPVMDAPVLDAAPTIQYQIQPQAAGGDTRRAYPVYAAPQAAPNPYADAPELPEYWDDAPVDSSFAPPSEQQSFAFGMAPSFGSAQNEPAYDYPRDATPSFAPPHYTQEAPPTQTFAPRQTMPEPPMPEPMAYQQQAPPLYKDEPSPQFRPFSDRGDEHFAPPKGRRLGSVARKARHLLNADEEYNALSYQDLQSTVDVSKAFHSPVYPEKKPEGE